MNPRLPAPLASAAVPIALILACVLVGGLGAPAFERTMTLILTYVVLVVGLQVFIGNSGIYSLGQIAFTAIGAYGSALLTLSPEVRDALGLQLPSLLDAVQLPTLTAALMVALGAGLLAALLALPLMRGSALAIPIATLALLVIVHELAGGAISITRGTSGLVGIPLKTGLASAAAWSVVAILVALAFKRSRLGYQLRASRESPVAAASIGVSLMRVRTAAFSLSAVLAAIGGSLLAHQTAVITPDTFFLSLTLTTLTMLIVGGMGSVFGAVIGALTVSAVDEILRGVENGADLLGLVHVGETPGLASIGISMLLLLALIALPVGLTGGREAGDVRVFAGLVRHPKQPPARSLDGWSRGRALPQGQLLTRQVFVSFGGVEALKGVGLSLRQGEILGLIGPNGAGKTTLVNAISGYQRPDGGDIVLDGHAITGFAPRRLARLGLSRSFQSALPFSGLTAIEGVAVAAMASGESRRRAMMVGAELLDLVGLEQHAASPGEALPAGEQRLLDLARSLAIRPRFLLLDEPAAGLNETEGERLGRVIREIQTHLGTGILLIEHDLDLVLSICPRVQVLENGETLTVGSPDEIRSDPRVIEAYLGHTRIGTTAGEPDDPA